ncbi:CehA/McbA family metallohydrolase [Thermasporomyces composti]|uniref:Polymerase/histidinol phosphatase N-terminal domain-containing protein n=1 Tax=Thermasporomyces composti TaxID=696763 RepID=A0A3D9V2B0_THECX|nr:CehA/McbA family metallohydrolase [Thermasporomyces composti]REF34913.1 hypothetical protein DFJ64_0279 [Thermasporomyces composti]
MTARSADSADERSTDSGVGDERTIVLTGRLDTDAPDWVPVPVDVPDGVREIVVRYTYDNPSAGTGAPGNALDIGIFDPRGHERGAAHGFRGWSGGARESFSISRSTATPGYLPGPIHPGTWHLMLGPYTITPQGLSYRIEVTLRFGPPGPDFVPRYAPRHATGRGRAWYRGDLHLHTVHSDGRREPEELVADVRAAGLDFMVSTEHNTSSASGVWGYHVPDDLLVIDGEEITTRNGHLVVAGLDPGTWLDWRYRARDGVFPDVLRHIHRQGALAIAAHPFCPFLGCAWKFGFDGLDAVEVWNGSWTPDDEVTLRQWDAHLVAAGKDGAWLPAVGGSDAHDHSQTVGLGQTVVLADDLTRDAILAGIRAGRCYVAESANVELDFSASAEEATAGIGDRLSLRPDTEVAVEVAVRGAPGTFVRLVTDAGPVAQLPVPESGNGTVTWRTTARAAAYIRAEVRRMPSGPLPFEPMVAFTNPIFLDVPS